MSRPRSEKEVRQALIVDLRATGHSWAQVASVLRERFRLNARTALRLAHCWSQREAAEQWSIRWPDDPKTFKNFSAWEQWPAPSGHMPSLVVLERLAVLYQCSIRDLLADAPDYGDAGTGSVPSVVAEVTGDGVMVGPGGSAGGRHVGVPGGTSPWEMEQFSRDAAPPAGVSEVEYAQLVRTLVTWTEGQLPDVSRRELLTQLSAAFALAATMPELARAEADDHRPFAVLGDDRALFDPAALDYGEDMLMALRRQGDIMGARVTLPNVLTHLQLADRLAKLAPPALRPRTFSLYANLMQLMGWLQFEIGNDRAAQYHYDQARGLAHAARNADLVTYVLASMSHLATWQGKPRIGIDHAVAAQAWAQQSDSRHAVAYAADIAARAYAADHQTVPTYSALDAELAALTQGTTGAPVASWWYFYDEAFHWSIRSDCALKLGDAERSLGAVVEAEARFVNHVNLHELTFMKLHRAEAHVRQGDADLAAHTLAEIVATSATATSQRIDKRVADLRADLTPWQRSRAVRQLDEALSPRRTT